MTTIFNLRKFFAAKDAPSGNDDRKSAIDTAKQSFELWGEWAATSDLAEACNYEACSAHFRCIITSLLN